ncbi:MAG TPA: LuxR C-terminal-related transcriptional regulator [Actinomycetota bacterium]|nr:LuxR C-terminal-related transcriptional regulator [Actinomycetota bacterium]
MSTGTRQQAHDKGASLEPSRTLSIRDPKLQPPRIRAGAVFRAGPVERLRRERGASVVVVSAPAGYGKTTLLTQWLARDRRRHAWLTLDAADNDLTRLLPYLALTLDGIHPLPPEVLEGARPGRRNSVDHAVSTLASAVASIPTPFLLVLNECHALHDRTCLRVLERLAEVVPEPSALVLSGRGVEVPLARLRAGGRVVDVGMFDLAMGEPEGRTLLENAGVRLRRQDVAELTRRTEGWPVGLYLASLVLRDPGAGVEEVRGDHWLIADYLSSELMPTLSRKKIAFLTRTSVLDRLSAPLCDAVLGSPGSVEVLSSIVRSDSFLVPLDEHREWYRYHQLVREFLLCELRRREPEIEPVLYERAAAWSEAHGMLESAVDYAHAAGDSEGVVRLVGRVAKSTYTAGRFANLSRWFEWLEEDGSLERHPALAVQGALVQALLGHPAEAERWADAAERGALPVADDPSDDSPFEAWLALLRALMCRRGPVEMKEDAEAAATLLAVRSPWRASAVLHSGVASILVGDPEEADARLTDAVALAEHAHAKAPAIAALSERALLAIGVSDWAAARDLLDRSRGIAETVRPDAYTTSALMFAASARLALHAGTKEEARTEVAKALRLQPRLTYALPHFAVQTFLEVASVSVALGDASVAATLLREARQIIRRRPDLGVLPGFAEEILERLQSLRSETPGVAALTSAEWRVLPLLSTHLSFREIGEQLHVSPHTVKSQAMSLYRKLGVSSRSEAIQRARELSLLEA